MAGIVGGGLHYRDRNTMFTANNNVILCHFIGKLSKSHIVVIVVVAFRT